MKGVILVQLQAYQGYFEQGSFYTAGKAIHIPERRRVTIIFEEQPPQDDTLDEHLTAMEKFINAMQSSDEDVPLSFERIKLREVEV